MSETKVEQKVKLNIHQKMLQATMNISRVGKNLKIEMGKDKNGNVRSYKAVSEGDVLNAVKSVEIELGIYSYPVSRTITETGILVNVATYGDKTVERKEQFMRIETVYRFVNIDDPKDYLDVTTYGDGIDGGDKAPGKAMTYADKYALLKAYKIETGDDPDQEGSKEYSKVEPKYKSKEERREEESSFSMTTKCSEEAATSIILASTPERLKSLLEYYKVKLVSDLSERQAHDALDVLLKAKK